jgi:imidazolonepropionase-like amidohydrolase
MLAEPPPGGFFSDPRLKYTARSKRDAIASQLAMSKEQLDLTARRYLEHRETVRTMNRAGVVLVAGTDSSVPPRIPGFALHDELVALVDAGLTPLEALRAATINAATVMKKTDDFGAIARGKRADMVLLEANPLDDIRNTQRIAAVVFRGQLLQRADLDRLLALAEAIGSRN